jgi:enamine deaminase RidA (YjgF/YER057c/UK114 family)
MSHPHKCDFDKGKSKKDKCEEKKVSIVCKTQRIKWENPPVVGVIPPLSQVGVTKTELYLSGQQFFRPDGTYPLDFTDRVRQAYTNIKNIAEYYGADLSGIERQRVLIAGYANDADFARLRDIVGQVEQEFFGPDGPFPPRTIEGLRTLANSETVAGPLVEIEVTILRPVQVPVCKHC